MANLTDITCSNIITMVYFDSSNISDGTMYLTYDSIKSDILGKKYGVAVAGYKDNFISNRVHFFLFGGSDINNILSNDLMKITIDIQGGGPVLYSEEAIICTTKPLKRRFATMKIVGSYLYLYGGLDELNNILLDLQRFSIINQIQEEITLSGNTPAPKLFG